MAFRIFSPLQRRLPTPPHVSRGVGLVYRPGALPGLPRGNCHCPQGIASGAMCSLRMWYPGGIGWQVAGLPHLGSNSRGKL
jgi:hypothetical protein